MRTATGARRPPRVPEWLAAVALAFPRAVEQRRVAAVYRALAANLRAMGTEGIGAARRGAVAALNLAYEELLAQRAAASGRDRELALLMSLFREARLAAEAAAALDPAGERPPPQAAAQADAIARAVLAGTAVPAIGPPRGASRALLALYRAHARTSSGPPGPGCRWINIRRRWTCGVLVREPWSVRC